jgi:hypothetical protein
MSTLYRKVRAWSAGRALFLVSARFLADAFARPVEVEWASMNSFRELGKLLVVIGIGVAGMGALLMFGAKLPFRLGRLPGDIVVQGRHSSFYFPIATCIVVSAVLTLLIWIVSFFRR